jgi:hypothetical protein
MPQMRLPEEIVMSWTCIGGHPAMGGQMVWCEPVKYLVREGRDFSKCTCDGIGCDKTLDRYRCRHIRYSPYSDTEAILYGPYLKEIIKAESIEHASTCIGAIIKYQGVEAPYSFNLCEACYVRARNIVFRTIFKIIRK